MLAEIQITNFAIIERLQLALEPGFNVLTGETGAGKSIVIDAVGALLGGKVGAEVVRTGTEQAHVEGLFPIDEAGADPALLEALADAGLALEDGALILSRDVHRSGRTVARINGRAVPASLLQQVGHHLIDIHGQSEHLSLLRTAYQLDLLDSYGGLLELRGRLAARVGELRQVRRDLDRLNTDERELARRADLLRFQAEEIDSAKLRPDEEEELVQERTLLANAEKLAAAADGAYQALYSGSDEQPAASDRLAEAAGHLAELARLDPTLKPQAEALDSAIFQVEEVGGSMRAYRDAVEFNPTRLATVEERLDLLHVLKRKYGASLAEVITYGEQASAELDSLVHGEERRAELQQREREELQAAGALAGELSEQRRAVARHLAEAVTAELADLNMKGARFDVSLEQVPDGDGVPLGGQMDEPRVACDLSGADRVTFLIAPNLGEQIKPLAKTASGGEMARLLLALKTVLSRADRIGTLIFDEVDVGVGGRSGRVVGEKLSSLTARHQVICVTHLPQVACYADAHYRIAKVVSGERTSTQVQRLAPQEQVGELAAMLAGSEASQNARLSAAEIIRHAAEWKERNRGSAPLVGA
ncbi:MAG: DNA repair protein RecN [Chloroflexota bacterium]